MYTLYYLPDACSLATQVVIHELNQKVEIVDIQQLENFSAINPVGTVPVLIDNDSTSQETRPESHLSSHREGAAVMLYLLNKHENSLLPTVGLAREQAIQDIMFANATMHPAYSRLFFIAQHITDETAKQSSFNAAAQAITSLWRVVEQQLAAQVFLGGDHPSAADIMLAVYSRWGDSFPVEIPLGPNTKKMLNAVLSMPNFQRALAAEQR